MNNIFDSSFFANEINFIRDISDEVISFAGYSIYYIPRSYISVDSIMNEVISSEFKHKYIIDAYLTDSSGWIQRDLSFNKLGLFYSGPQIKFCISKTDFKRNVPNDVLKNYDQPNEGDLVFIPYTKQLLEIKDSATSDPYSSGGTHFFFEISCEPFDFSAEKFSVTGIQTENGADLSDVIMSLRDGAKHIEENETVDYDEIRNDESDKLSENNNYSINKELRSQTPIIKKQSIYGE